jgi:hypothetical protein
VESRNGSGKPPGACEAREITKQEIRPQQEPQGDSAIGIDENEATACVAQTLTPSHTGRGRCRAADRALGALAATTRETPLTAGRPAMGRRRGRSEDLRKTYPAAGTISQRRRAFETSFVSSACFTEHVPNSVARGDGHASLGHTAHRADPHDGLERSPLHTHRIETTG